MKKGNNRRGKITMREEYAGDNRDSAASIIFSRLPLSHSLQPATTRVAENQIGITFSQRFPRSIKILALAAQRQANQAPRENPARLTFPLSHLHKRYSHVLVDLESHRRPSPPGHRVRTLQYQEPNIQHIACKHDVSSIKEHPAQPPGWCFHRPTDGRYMK